MIPSPNLDDRTFRDIVDEAMRLIPQYCPEWTNFNPSDPGVTLVELFAWMTEMVLYRLNKVPEKNYLAFLDLMGVRLRPPQPARALLTFQVSDKTDKILVRAGTRVASQPLADGEPVGFETGQDLCAVRNRVVKSFSRHRDSYRDHSEIIAGGRTGEVEVFGGERRVDRFLYLSDPSFESFRDPAVLTLRFGTPKAGRVQFPRMLEWEVWSGDGWTELEPAEQELERNTIAFHSPAEVAPTVVNGVEGHWLRGRLLEVPHEADDTRLDTVSARVQVAGEGALPELARVNAEAGFFKTLELERSFYPFDREPGVDTTFYIASDEYFSRPGAEVELDFQLNDPSQVDLPAPSPDLVLRWEYSNGKRWKLLGRSGALRDGYRPPAGFADDSACLSAPRGSVRFTLPRDIAQVEVDGLAKHWIRCRVEQGNYGRKGTWTLQGDTWEWTDEHPLRPPCVRTLSIRYGEPLHPLVRVLAYNDFLFSDYSTLSAKEYKDFQPFQPISEENPAFYLGFAEPFPNEPVQLYLDVVDGESEGRERDGTERDRADGREQVVVWEYWNGDGWSNLYGRDGSHGFTQGGFLQFVGPKDHRTSRRFGDDLFWIRARLEMGGYHQAPRVAHVLLNTVEAFHLSSFGETILGSSDGRPNQVFRFPRGPVLDGEVMVIHEKERPPEATAQDLVSRLGPSAVTRVEDGWAIVWARVDSFHESAAGDRHYTKDVVTGEIRFGDGVRGRVPPKGDQNVRCRWYQVGGGDKGNVPAGALTVPKQSIAYLSGVTNHFPAAGGSAQESVEAVKERGPHFLKSRNRAVTAEDFEWLAREASGSVARVKALPSSRREGEVTVIVVPKVSSRDIDSLDKPVPSTELLRRVRRHLDSRRLVTTVVNVVKPVYRELQVEVVLARGAAVSSDRVKRDVRRSLQRFLHPLVGGRDGAGWPFGRSVLKVDLFRVVERVEGVDIVEQVRIFDRDRQVEIEQLRLREDQLPALVAVEVTEKSQEALF